MNYLEQLFSLKGKTAMVTGASRGLGQAIAVALAEAGADIVGVASRLENLADTEQHVRDLGRTFYDLACDQSNLDQVVATAAAAEQAAAQIDILVNNAGIIRRSPAVDFSTQDWNAVLRTNLDGVFVLCREIGRGMVLRGNGKIINIASLLSFFGGITVPAYAASKGGIHVLTKALANEWAASNVQVNAIAPGYFETDNTQALREDPARYNEILGRIPCQRWGKPQELAGAAVFLATSASDYVTGHTLLVDGGYSAR